MEYTKIKIYKYKLAKSHLFVTPIQDIHWECDYFKLRRNGSLYVEKGFSFDGPSGPTIDTKGFIAASLPHDAFYQLMRQGVMNIPDHKEIVDKYLHTLCIEYGMNKLRAWYVHKAVRRFGRSSCVNDVIEVNKK